MNPLALATFLAVIVVAACSPGPCLAYSLRCGLGGGPRAVFDVGLGYATSGATWVVISALGFTTLLQTTGWCDRIASVGGIVICAAGVIMAVLSVRFGPRLPVADAENDTRSRPRTIVAAMLFHAASPGTVVLYVAAAPVLISQACGPTTPHLAEAFILAGSAALILLSVNAGYARVLGRLRNFLESRRNRQLLEVAMGFALVCTGISLAL